ncbi:MAG: hypothetical protein HY077_11845 [Elusimicrobia bacterium]|nr:hypothetical protein [Elusimicrobiota bacterium]
MSLLDAFGQDATCPLCGSVGAKKLLFFVKCPNRSCANNAGGLDIGDVTKTASLPSTRPRASAPAPDVSKWRKAPAFDPASASLKVRYKNFKGEEKAFDGNPRSLRVKGVHVSLQVSPSGTRIALAKSRIANLVDVEAEIQKYPQPTAKERQILKYHGYKGSSSAAYEELRKKYPNW